jgi:hypothetical protein
MPFTFSHPAVVLPMAYLPKKWFSMTGLIVGSIVPDFEYFLRMKVMSIYSHTLLGLFWFDVPLGLIIAFIYHQIVKQTFLNHMPLFIKARCTDHIFYNWTVYFKKYWYVVIYSILIGASSHILWDAFTHDHGYFAARIDWLNQSTQIFNKTIYHFKIAQHGSTIIGAIAISYAVYMLPIRPAKAQQGTAKYWLYISLGLALILVFKYFICAIREPMGNVIVTIISSFLLSAISVSLVYVKSKASL